MCKMFYQKYLKNYALMNYKQYDRIKYNEIRKEIQEKEHLNKKLFNSH